MGKIVGVATFLENLTNFIATFGTSFVSTNIDTSKLQNHSTSLASSLQATIVAKLTTATIVASELENPATDLYKHWIADGYRWGCP